MQLKNFEINKFYKTKFCRNTTNFITKESERDIEKNLMKKIYKQKVDDRFFSDHFYTLIKSSPAFIAFRGNIRMDYLAKELDNHRIPITVVNLDLNPVFNTAFETFYPFVQETGYALFFKGKLADTEEFMDNIEKGTEEKYLKINNLI